jgi:ADP-heptose:LPS heptosyltransferase
MRILKTIELAFRRFLLRSLSAVVKRGTPLPEGMDFNAVKVLFVRQDRIGDVLVSTPLIHALKLHFPGMVIDFLLSSNNHFVLQHEPLVRKRWVYRKNVFSALMIVLGVRHERYDFAIDLMDNPSTTSTVICALAGARWNIGLSKENAYVYDVTVPLLSRKETHIVDRLAMLLTVFGLKPEKERLRIRYAVSEKSDAAAHDFLKEKKIEGRFIIGLNISPARGVRFWGVTNFQELICDLFLNYPEYPLLILSQPSDRSVAEQIAQPFDSVLLSPETKTFDAFAALVKSIGFLVTPDTSAVHLAAAFDIPSVVLYVQSNKGLRVWVPYGSESEILVTDVDDLTTIPPADVFAAISRLLQKKGPTGPSRARTAAAKAS